MTRVTLETLGCKANRADTDALRDGIADSLNRDVEFVSSQDTPDVVVLNTCTVTHTADADARQLVRRYKRANPDTKVVVTGCYAQVSGNDLKAMPEVDHVVGNVHKSALPELVAKIARGDSPEIKLDRTGHRDWSPSLRDATAIRTLPQGRTRPFVRVQDGCNYVCSFCIIPQARGASRSIPLPDVVDTVHQYERAGAKEVVLTGIHLGHWGRDFKPKQRFGTMLEALLQQTSVERLRISSLEPNEVDNHVLKLVSEESRVCPHLHVPLQSGHDPTLGRMKRVYRTDWYRTVIQTFRETIPHGAWGIDVMVGFPGEDDDAFQASYRFLRSIPFTYLHVFPYSARMGTPAATMPDQVDPKVKQERTRQLIALSDERRAAHSRAAIGRRLSVLVESKRVGGQLRGFSPCYVPVSFDGSDELKNQIVDVDIVDVNGAIAVGKCV